MTCAHCGKTSSSYFRVARTDAVGTERGTPVFVCSILHLVSWSYDYGIRRGLQGVQIIRRTVERLTGAVKGGG